jgi:aryl-alcohol dehydrogenase-like predicted oxidoreductase
MQWTAAHALAKAVFWRASSDGSAPKGGGGVQRRSLGTSGKTISALGFGCGTAGGLMNKGDTREQREIVARALDAGITYFDTAPNYGNGLSETNLGRVIADLGIRDLVQIGTKVDLLVAGSEAATAAAVGPDHASVAAPDLDQPTALRTIFEGSLRRLGVDHVDMLFLHSRVRAESIDTAMNAAELFARLKAAGQTELTGFTAHGETPSIKELASARALDSMQAYFSAANPSSGYAGYTGEQQDFGGVVDVAAAAGLGVINVQPLSAGGLLDQAHPYARDFTHGRLLSIGARLGALARRLDLESVYELSLRFALSKPGISCVLVGFSSMEQLEQGLRWCDRGALTDEQLGRILSLTTRGEDGPS